MIKEFGLRIKEYYLKWKWKWAIKEWFNNNPEPLNKLRPQLNKVKHELRQIRSRKKTL
jgi:hypothetical protein